MRFPSINLIVDAAVLVAAVRGRSSGALSLARASSLLMTTDRVVQEARRRIELGLRRPDLVPVLHALVSEMTVVPVVALEPYLEDCAAALKQAVPSGNGSTKDAHVLALARDADADIWTTDRDFAGTGVATWSTPNLLRGLAASS